MTAEPVREPHAQPTRPMPGDLPRAVPHPALVAIADRLARGEVDAATAGTLAAELRDAAETIARDGDALKRRLLTSLSVNHDVNNALVGIVGNAQLLGLGPAAALPGVRERLDVIARESNRIKQATLKLSELKQALIVEGGTP